MIMTIKMATTPTAMQESLLLPRNVRRNVASVVRATKTPFYRTLPFSR